jgi:pimeloyl-ACP methyl ester carboxylesterase
MPVDSIRSHRSGGSWYGRPVALHDPGVSLPDPIDAKPSDLPAELVAVLDWPAEPGWITVEAAGNAFAARTWGDPEGAPLLLIHGVTASSGIWWRVGPALAAGLHRRVVAVDQAGHGRTGRWSGHHRFRDNAADLVAFAVAAGLARPDLRVVGHSWGAMSAAALPAAGIRPEVLVLLDPPAIPLAAIAAMLDDPIERHYDDVDEALAAIGRLHPTWPWGDVVGKAEALTQFDEAGVRAVLTENGDWDGGLADLSDPAAASVAIRLVRGEPASGGLVPDPAAAALAARIGAEHVLTIRGGSHSPMRTRPETTVLALLRALQPD